MAVIKIVPMPGAKGDKGDEGATGAQGPQGPIGATGSAGADALWNYNGAWQSNAAYAVGDVVTYQGQLYYTKAITTAGTLPTDTTKFDLIAEKGADGEPGLNGLEGEQGPQGEPGPQGEQGPGGLNAVWAFTGEYNPGSQYAVGDLVTYEGQTWYRKNANGGNVGDTPSVGLFWDLIAAKGEPGDSGTSLNFWNFIGDPGVPTESGALVVDGLSARSGGNLTLHATTGGKIVLAGSNGEFLFDSNIESNQIATIGNIQEIDTLSNGLVVTGQIDDVVINPAGTMSLSVQDGYTALMDVVAHSATFNGDVQITNLNGNRETTIDTPVTINNEVTIQTEYGEGWTFNNDGYVLGPWLSTEEDPGNTGRYLRVNGITRADNNPLLVSSSGTILINGTNGEFLNFHGDPNNQIATIGNISDAVSGSLSYKSGSVPSSHHGSAGDLKNDIKYDDTHMYVCVADYTDGSAIIWKRINWASGNW